MVDDGGPAFPAFSETDWQTGMSLRTWLAGQALVGVLVCRRPDSELRLDLTANLAVRLADAMISQLKWRSNPTEDQ